MGLIMTTNDMIRSQPIWKFTNNLLGTSISIDKLVRCLPSHSYQCYQNLILGCKMGKIFACKGLLSTAQKCLLLGYYLFTIIETKANLLCETRRSQYSAHLFSLADLFWFAGLVAISSRPADQACCGRPRRRCRDSQEKGKDRNVIAIFCSVLHNEPSIVACSLHIQRIIISTTRKTQFT